MGTTVIVPETPRHCADCRHYRPDSRQPACVPLEAELGDCLRASASGVVLIVHAHRPPPPGCPFRLQASDWDTLARRERG
jgi:hypothetical protein